MNAKICTYALAPKIDVQRRTKFAHPDQRVFDGLFQTTQKARLALIRNCIVLNAIVSKLPLLLAEPHCCQRIIRQQEEAKPSNHEGYNSLENEKPLPACYIVHAVKTVEDACSDEASKCCGEDVTGVEDRYACGDFLASVPSAEEVYCTRVDLSRASATYEKL